MATAMGKDPVAMARERELDEAVLRGVIEAEPGAFDRFVDRFGNRIYAFGLRMCGQREDAEDVFQETLVSVFRKLETLREPGALTTWLYRIVANTCLSKRRRSRYAPQRELSLEELLPRGETVEEGPLLPAVDDPSQDAYRSELAGALDEAARDLSPEFRVVWLLRDVEGLSTEQTAAALGISVPNAKMRLHRARLTLRRRLVSFHPGKGSA